MPVAGVRKPFQSLRNPRKVPGAQELPDLLRFPTCSGSSQIWLRGTVPGILGLVWLSFRPNSEEDDPTSTSLKPLKNEEKRKHN